MPPFSWATFSALTTKKGSPSPYMTLGRKAAVRRQRLPSTHKNQSINQLEVGKEEKVGAYIIMSLSTTVRGRKGGKGREGGGLLDYWYNLSVCSIYYISGARERFFLGDSRNWGGEIGICWTLRWLGGVPLACPPQLPRPWLVWRDNKNFNLACN